MHVAIDSARHHDQTRGIDFLRSAFDPRRNRHDAAVAHCHVGTKGVAGGGNGAAANGEIIVRHNSTPRAGCWAHHGLTRRHESTPRAGTVRSTRKLTWSRSWP